MNFIEIFEESISVLNTNKMRTALSTLGIIIGVGSVIALMTLGEASQASVKSRIQSLGSNLLSIRAGSASSGFLGGQSGSSASLTLDDANAILEEDRITTVSDVAAEYSGRKQISYERNNMNASITGISPSYFSVRNITVEYGSEISETDNLISSKVAVISPGVAEEFFGNESAGIGANINIDGSAYQVIGITKSSGNGFAGAGEIVYIPISTAQKVLFGVKNVTTIYAVANDENSMEGAQNQIGFFLLERHRIEKPEDADFSITSQEDILETVTEITQTFTFLLTGIAAISLVVGGIGIMNIMLVTVTERTMEIGLRKALGAKRKTIIYQFLVESIVLTIVGGLLGTLLGIGISYAITKYMNISFILSVNSVFLAAGVSCAIGILFGWYPAQKASKLQPIEALRYE